MFFEQKLHKSNLNRAFKGKMWTKATSIGFREDNSEQKWPLSDFVKTNLGNFLNKSNLYQAFRAKYEPKRPLLDFVKTNLNKSDLYQALRDIIWTIEFRSRKIWTIWPLSYFSLFLYFVSCRAYINR